MAALLSGEVADAGEEFGGEVAIGLAQGGVGARLPHDRSSEGGVLSAEEYRREMATRFTTWNEITGTATAA